MSRKSEKNLEDTQELTNIYNIKSRKPVKTAPARKKPQNNKPQNNKPQNKKTNTSDGKKSAVSNQSSSKKRVVPQTNGKYVSGDNKRKAHSKKKKKVRRLVRLFFLLIVFIGLILGMIFFISEAFFKVEKVSVKYTNTASAQESGEKFIAHYKNTDIIKTSSLSKGDNLIFTSMSSAKKKILSAMPYISSVEIKREFPDAVTVILTQSEETFCFVSGEKYVMTDERCYVLGNVNKKEASSYTIVSGVKFADTEVGQEIVINKNSEKILEFLKCVERGELKKINKIDLSNVNDVYMTYDNRITIHFGKMSDEENSVTTEKKLSLAAKTLKKEDSMNKTQKGTLNLSISKKAYFKAQTDEKKSKK